MNVHQILTVLLGVFTSVRSQATFESSESLCQRPWIERMTWSSQNPTQTSSDEFREHVLLGKPARVVIEKGSYREVFTLDNINMNGNVICGEFSQRLTSPLGADAEFQPILVCTNGQINYLNTSASSWGGNVLDQVWTVNAISFWTRDYSPNDAPITSRYLDGSSSMQYPDNYVTMAVKSEMRGVMRDRAYAFNMDNIHVDQKSSHISGQSLNHVSQSYTPAGGIIFRSQPYHWLSSWETTGRRDSSRWTVGNIRPVRHTNDYVALQWYADACWTIVYRHDKDGKRLGGSLDMLKAQIRMGHRVRVHFDGFTLEANSVSISPSGNVVAQTSSEMARRLGFGTDKTFFNTKTRRIYRLIHTSGEIRSFYFFIENGLLSERKGDRLDITWSVDTRPWSPVLSVDNQNQVTFGRIRDLALNMIDATTRIKLDIKEKGGVFNGQISEMFIEIDSLRTPSPDALRPDVISQTLGTLPYNLSQDGKSYLLDLNRPESQYIEVSTITGMTAHRFNMNTRQYAGQASWAVTGISWFQDARLSS